MSPGPEEAAFAGRRSTGARELAQLALNRDCLRLAALRLTHRDPGDVARQHFGEQVRTEGSRITLGAGKKFERSLTNSDFARLMSLLEANGVVPPSGARVLDVRGAHPESHPDALRAREELTLHAVRRLARRDPTAPTVVWQPRLALPVDGQTGHAVESLTVYIEPDALVATGEGDVYAPLEVKSYCDRDGRTDANGLTLARLQAAIELLALEAAVARVGATAPLEPRIALVLRRRASQLPTFRWLQIAYEADLMRHVLAGAPGRLAAALRAIPEGESLDTTIGVEAIPIRYTEGCRDFCGLARHCEAAERRRGALSVLGAAMEEAAGVVGSLPRLVSLVDGREPPTSAAEAAVVESFRVVRAALRLRQLGPNGAEIRHAS